MGNGRSPRHSCDFDPRKGSPPSPLALRWPFRAVIVERRSGLPSGRWGSRLWTAVQSSCRWLCGCTPTTYEENLWLNAK